MLDYDDGTMAMSITKELTIEQIKKDRSLYRRRKKVWQNIQKKIDNKEYN